MSKSAFGASNLWNIGDETICITTLPIPGGIGKNMCKLEEIDHLTLLNLIVLFTNRSLTKTDSSHDVLSYESLGFFKF